MMKSALITLCVLLVSGCAAKYEGNFLHSVELIDNSLLIVGDHSTGLQKPTFGSHKSGLTINSQTFFLAEYDVSAAPPKLKSINFLFRSSDEDAGYSFKIVSTNTVLVIKSLPGGTACVEKLIVSTGGRGEICVSNGLGRIGHTAFIFNRSGSHFVANHKGFEMYSTLTLGQVSNTLSGVFSRPDLAREIGGAELRLSDDLKYLITFPERPQNEVRFLGNDQEPLVKRMYSQDNCTSRDAESLTNRLGWFCLGWSMELGVFGQTNVVSIKDDGDAKWDYRNHRVLVMPIGFNIHHKELFEGPLRIWDYAFGTRLELHFDFEEFERVLKLALKMRRKES